MKKRKL